MSEKLFIQPDRCKECGLCVRACPRGALSIGSKANAAGYRFVVADDSKCVKCAICTKACPDYVFEIKEI